MPSSSPLSAVARLAIAGAAAAAVLLALSLVQGVSQGQYQVIRPAAEMTAMLLANGAALKTELWVDFLFLILYGSFFALLPSALAQGFEPSHQGAVAARAGATALLLTAALDAAENANLLSSLSMAAQGLPLSQDAIQAQAVASQVKFVASYFGLFALSFALDPSDRTERALAFVLRWIQAPVGVAIFVASAPVLRPLHLARAVFFVVGLLWIAAVLAQRARRGAP